MIYKKKDLVRIQDSLSVFPFSLLLGAASFLYGLVVRARLQAYRSGFIAQEKLPGFVVSIGNISVGGTGKTPMTILVAQWARAKGYEVCVLSRGYGGRHRGEVLEVSDGHQIKASWKECGDEPYLIATNAPGIPVVVSRKRYLGGMYAAEKFGSKFFILDDGFQHLGLKRDLDIVLLDASRPFGNGHLLPLGTLREPPYLLSRANVLVLSRFLEDRICQKVERELARRFPATPIFKSTHKPVKLVFPVSQATFDPDYINGKKVAAFAGIGNPISFQNTLAVLGARVLRFTRFPDHHVYLIDEIEALAREAKAAGAEMLLTTEKDWARVGNSVRREDIPFGYLAIAIELLEKREEFFRVIEKAASEANTN